MEYFADKVFAGKPILIRFFIFNRRPIFALTVFLILGGLRRLFL